MDLLLTPMSHLSRVSHANDRWLAFGADPAFQCIQAGQDALSGGWYLVEFEVEVHRGKLHAPCFYVDYGQGFFLEEDKIPLRLDLAGVGSHVVRRMIMLKGGVSSLRFDPSVLPAEFTVKKLALTRWGRRTALAEMLSDAAHGRRVSAIFRAITDLLFRGPRRMAERLYQDYVAQHASTAAGDNYAAWVALYDPEDEEAITLRKRMVGNMESLPVFSVVLPTFNTEERWLRKCIESVLKQAYPHWELCIADDASTNPSVRRVLAEYVAADARIKVVHRTANGHIAAASNSALGIATGDWVALLDHDDELAPEALLECAVAINANPGWRMLFTDEDKIDVNGVRSDPFFKPDWNPELFQSQNCVCHLGVYHRTLMERIGGFKAGHEGAQDWDLALRASEQLDASQIGHVPKVLYHWRMIKGSTALAPSQKNYAHSAAQNALQEHLDRVSPGSAVEGIPGCSGYFRVSHPLPEPLPSVSILIPTRDRADLLRQCIDSLLTLTDYDAFEIIVLDNGSEERATAKYFEELRDEPNVRVLRIDMPFNFSTINNKGAEAARGDVLVLMNNDVEAIHGGWLRELVSHVIRPEIGAVGAMLYYPNDTVQHAGVILGIGGVAGHAYHGLQRGNPGDKHRAALTQAVSAVTGACLAVRAGVYREVGGLDETLAVAFNDIDFCIRVREAGYRNVWTPFAEMYHHESASRGYEDTPEKIARFKKEEALMKERWGNLLQSDPYYNVNLALDASPYSLAYPPRTWHPEILGGLELGEPA